ncbi:MAG: hypothetical protein ABI693_06845 [Bryobacteraceae bacterium]
MHEVVVGVWVKRLALLAASEQQNAFAGWGQLPVERFAARAGADDDYRSS